MVREPLHDSDTEPWLRYRKTGKKVLGSLITRTHWPQIVQDNPDRFYIGLPDQHAEPEAAQDQASRQETDQHSAHLPEISVDQAPLVSEQQSSHELS
jgi:hypothetical protein